MISQGPAIEGSNKNGSYKWLSGPEQFDLPVKRVKRARNISPVTFRIDANHHLYPAGPAGAVGVLLQRRHHAE